MSLSRRRLRALRGIERDLAASEPGLHAFFLSFNSRAGENAMPPAERIAPWPSRMLARLRPPGDAVEGRAPDQPGT